MDLPTLLQELGNALEDRDNPESDIILVNLIDEIRRVLPREPDKAADLLTGTLMALGSDPSNSGSFMNLTLVHSMVPEILAGLQPLPVHPPNLQIGILMLGEAISRDENLDTETFYNILVKPFIDGEADIGEAGRVLSDALDILTVMTAEDQMAKCHLELASEWLKSKVPVPGPVPGPGPVPMDLTEDIATDSSDVFRAYLVGLSTEQNQMKQLVLLKKMFSIVEGPTSGAWYSDQLGRIIDQYIDDQAIFNSALTANEFLESEIKKKMLADTKSNVE